MARFADEDLIIDFDNFVRCLIRLETLFSEYTLNNLTDSVALCFQVQDNLFRKLCTGTKATSKLSYHSGNAVCMLLLDLGIGCLGQAAEPEPGSLSCKQLNVDLKTKTSLNTD